MQRDLQKSLGSRRLSLRCTEPVEVSKAEAVASKTAEIFWTYPDGGGLSAPAVANGRVYIGSGNSPFFYSLGEETGVPHWIYKLGHRVEEATLCIYRDKVFVLAATSMPSSSENEATARC